jgi:hypothetical protein
MGAANELIDLERSGWRVLSTSAEAAGIFYGHVLDRSPVMLLPGGMNLTERDTVLQSMSGQPWSSFEMGETQVLQPTDDVGVVAYDVLARRDHSAYAALVSSHYVHRDGRWRLFFHQQTPRPAPESETR